METTLKETTKENGTDMKTPLDIELTKTQLSSIQKHMNIVVQLEQELKAAQIRQQEILSLILDAHDVAEAKNVELNNNILTVSL